MNQQFSQAQTWIGGPTHTVKKQHVPGYAGHISHMNAENQFAKSFAKITNKCIDGNLQVGIDQPAQEKYQTVNHMEFGKPKIMAENGQRILTPPTVPSEIEPIDRVPVVGYQGFRPKYRHPIKQVIQPQTTFQLDMEQKRDVVPVVGYTGYIPKVKAQNMYAHSYHQLAQQSIFY